MIAGQLALALSLHNVCHHEQMVASVRELTVLFFGHPHLISLVWLEEL